MKSDHTHHERRKRGSTWLCIVIALLAVGIANVSGQVATAAPRNVTSYLPPPPTEFPAVLTPPAYAGRWVGKTRQTQCQSKIPGNCRIYPVEHQVTLELTQIGTLLTGALIEGLFSQQAVTGYVSEDSGMFLQTAVGGVSLKRAGPGFVGISVQDVGINENLVRSMKSQITSLRRDTDTNLRKKHSGLGRLFLVNPSAQ